MELKEKKLTEPEWKPLRTMTDSELREYLDHNEIVDPRLLAVVCSEILRRNHPMPVPGRQQIYVGEKSEKQT